MTLWNADCYAENSALQQSIARNFLQRLTSEFQLNNSLILDIGCGNGRVTQILSESFPGNRIIGVDLSEDMIAHAKRHYPKMTFAVDRAEKLKTIPSTSVDAITSFCCLHWVHDLESAFHAMDRVLKPGGWIGLVFAAETGYDDPIDRAYAQATNESPWAEHLIGRTAPVEWNIVDKTGAQKLVESVGFKTLLIEPMNYYYQFENIQTFQRWIGECFLKLKLLPLDLQESCSQRIAELYLEFTGQSSTGKCDYLIDALMVLAKKVASPTHH